MGFFGLTLSGLTSAQTNTIRFFISFLRTSGVHLFGLDEDLLGFLLRLGQTIRSSSSCLGEHASSIVANALGKRIVIELDRVLCRCSSSGLCGIDLGGQRFHSGGQ